VSVGGVALQLFSLDEIPDANGRAQTDRQASAVARDRQRRGEPVFLAETLRLLARLHVPQNDRPGARSARRLGAMRCGEALTVRCERQARDLAAAPFQAMELLAP